MRTLYADLAIPRVLATRALSRLSSRALHGPWAVTRDVRLAEAPLPSPQHVRLRNRVGLICGSDMHLVRAEGAPAISLNALPRGGRMYLGHEVCTEVVELGHGVTDLEIGDRVALRYPFHWCATLGVEPACRHCQDGNGEDARPDDQQSSMTAPGLRFGRCRGRAPGRRAGTVGRGRRRGDGGWRGRGWGVGADQRDHRWWLRGRRIGGRRWGG